MPKKKPLTKKVKPAMKPRKKVSRSTKSVRTSKKSSASIKQLKYLPQLIFALVFAAIGSYFLIRSFAAPVDKNPTAQFVPDQLIVKFKPGVPGHVAQKLQERFALREAKNIPQIGVKVLKVNPRALEAVQKALSHNPAVEFVEKDYLTETTAVTPNDPEWPRQGGSLRSHNITETDKAWDITRGSPNVTVAVLDSGMTKGLADIGSRILPGGYDFINNDSDPTDECGHGTRVTGIIAADTNNAVGIAGYDWAAKILPVRVLGNCTGSYSAFIAGITYAADHNVRVINMSFGGASSSAAMDSAIAYARSKGIVLVAAAGNDACDCKRYPAAAPGVISVGASDQLDALISYSNYGPSWVKVAAPGQNPTTNPEGHYFMVGGTSSASPVVASIVALMLAAKPTATPAQVEAALYSSVDPVVGDHKVQYGRVNAFKAVQALLGSTTTPPPADTTAPTAAVSSPVSGATISGAVTVNVNASDAVGVSRVELYRNGALYATDTSSPYSFYWDTTSVPNGSYSFVAKAYDTAGNVGTSSTVSYTVNNGPVADTTAPTARVTAPTSGATVSGSSVSVAGSGSDNVGVVSTELYIDGLLRASNPGSSVSFAWNTTQENNGSHSIVVRAVDAAGNVGSSATVTVNVNNATEGTAPVVTIQAPTNGTILSGNSLTVRASATDNVGVTQMQVLVDGKVKHTTGANTLNYSFNTKGLKKGSHTIQVRAYDAAGNVGSLQVIVSK